MNKEIVYQIVRDIPKGKVATYGQIAKLAHINNARVVGHILHQNPDSKRTPCHRVVNAKGCVAKNFAFGGGKNQRRLLEQEGVIFDEEKIDLVIYGWNNYR